MKETQACLECVLACVMHLLRLAQLFTCGEPICFDATLDQMAEVKLGIEAIFGGRKHYSYFCFLDFVWKHLKS